MTGFVDNEGSTSAFDDEAFATFIDDDDVPGFDSLNNSTFFDRVMHTSKLFDAEASSLLLNESLTKLNESLSMLVEPVTLKSARMMNRRKVSGSAETSKPLNSLPAYYMAVGIDEETEEEETDSDLEEFQEQILCAFLMNKIKNQKPQAEKLDVESVTSVTASLSSNGSSASGSAAKAPSSSARASVVESVIPAPKNKHSRTVKKPVTSCAVEGNEGQTRRPSSRRSSADHRPVRSLSHRRNQCRRASIASTDAASFVSKGMDGSSVDHRPARSSSLHRNQCRRASIASTDTASVVSKGMDGSSVDHRSARSSSLHRNQCRRASIASTETGSIVSKGMDASSATNGGRSVAGRGMDTTSATHATSASRGGRSVASKDVDAISASQKVRRRMSSRGCRMDSSLTRRSSSRGGDHINNSNEEVPENPRRTERMRERSHSMGKAINDDETTSAPATPMKCNSMDSSLARRSRSRASDFKINGKGEAPETPSKVQRMKERSPSMGKASNDEEATFVPATPKKCNSIDSSLARRSRSRGSDRRSNGNGEAPETPSRVQRMRERSQSVGKACNEDATSALAAPKKFKSMDSSLARRSRSSSRGSDRKSNGHGEVPETPLRAQRMRDRSQSVCKASDEEAAAAPGTPKKGNSMDLRRVTRTPRRGQHGLRTSMGQDILKRNLDILQTTDNHDDKSPVDQSKRRDVWKQRRSKSFGDTDAFLALQKKVALERANRMSTLQAVTATLTNPKAATPELSAATKLSLKTGALDRISQGGLLAKESIKDRLADEASVTIKDDFSLLVVTRSLTTTPQRRMRRRGSCAA